MRNRTVQSVLARRHMFNNGGMVPPTPKASGILASSPSLVDAVSNDALSDMGGGTLSMAQGGAAVNMQPSYVFNEGGIAKFNLGGSPNANVIISKVLNGTANADEIRAVEQSSFMQDPRVAQAVRVYKGDEPGFPIPLRPDVNVGEKLQNNKVRDLKVGNLTDADRAIPTQEGVSVPSINSKLKFDSDELRRMGATEAEINEERKRVAEINSLPLSTFKQPAIDINAPSPGEEAIVDIAQSALTRPVPQVEEPKISAAPIKEVSRQDMEAPLGAPPDGSPAPEVAVTAEDMPPPFDSSGDQGEEPPAVATPEEVKDQNQLFANLAKATSKDTKTDAVEAVVEATNMMGGEGGAVGVDGTMTTGDDTIIVRNDEGESKPVNSDVLISAFKLNGSDTDENLQIAVSDDIIKMAKNAEDGEVPNMNSLRKRIEALIPAVEEDSQTQGLLIAVLGAAIAGGESPNALKNISDGMQKALPGLINFGAKQKAAKRVRNTEIAKFVIGEELKLAAEGRADKREIAKEGRVGEHYVLTKPADIRGQKIGANIPFYLTKTERQDLQKLNPNIALFPLKYVKKLDTQVGSGKTSLEDLNRLYGPAKQLGESPFENYKSIFQPTVFFPKGAAMLRAGEKGGDVSMTMSDNAWKAWEKEYFRVSGNYGKIHRRIADLEKMDINKLVGVNVIKGKFGDLLAGVSKGIPGKNTRDTLAMWSRSLLSGQKLSELAKAENRGRLILARITPLILGESGKTISDADRIRVAKTLGFEVDTGTDAKGNETFLGIKGIRKNIFQNPEQIRDALKGVRELMAEKYSDIHKIHSAFAQRVGRKIEPLQGTKENPLKADLTK